MEKKYRYKVTNKMGRSYYITNSSSLASMNSWKRGYNKNYANGKRAAKSKGIAKIIQVPTVKRRATPRNNIGWNLNALRF